MGKKKKDTDEKKANEQEKEKQTNEKEKEKTGIKKEQKKSPSEAATIAAYMPVAASAGSTTEATGFFFLFFLTH